MQPGKLEVSNSSISLYRLCPKRYYFYYVENLKPRRKSSSLALGSVIHDAFDKYYKGSSMKEIVSFIDTSYKDTMSTLPPEEAEDAYIDSKTALGMFLNFPFDQLKFDKIESEREFRIPLMKGVDFVGRIDGKVLHNGFKWIREVKTTGETKQMFENRASVSGQATGYTWAIQELDGEAISGVIFDGLRKPRLIKKSSEDMYEFGQRIYIDYCDAKKKDSYFYRYPTYRSETQLQFWLSDTKSTTRTIQRALKCGDFPRNTGSCWVFNQACPYKSICFESTIDPVMRDLLYEPREEGDGGKETEANEGRKAGGISGSNEVVRG